METLLKIKVYTRFLRKESLSQTELLQIYLLFNLPFFIGREIVNAEELFSIDESFRNLFKIGYNLLSVRIFIASNEL